MRFLMSMHELLSATLWL